MEDFLRDSLGIAEENTMQVAYEEEVCNVSFTSVLASIEEEEVNNEEAVEEVLEVNDVVVSRTELTPSLQKLQAQRAALLKLGLDSGIGQMSEMEGGDQKGVDQEVRGTVEESFERSNEEASCSQEQEGPPEDSQHQGNDSLTVETQDPVLPEVEEKPGDEVGGTEHAEEERVDADIIGEVEVEVEAQAETHDHSGFKKELDGLEMGVGETELPGEGVDCSLGNIVEEEGEHEEESKGVEGGVSKGGELNGNGVPSVGIKNVEHSENTSHDSGLSGSNDVSLVENEQQEENESSEGSIEAASGAETIVEGNSGTNSEVYALGKGREALQSGSGVAVAKEQSGSNGDQNLTLKVKALAAASTTTQPPSIEAVTEDFAWFDCPGLKVTEVEDGLQVDVEDRQLGIAAMEGLKHKYSITQQV